MTCIQVIDAWLNLHRPLDTVHREKKIQSVVYCPFCTKLIFFTVYIVHRICVNEMTLQDNEIANNGNSIELIYSFLEFSYIS